jgi:hypothetical protein
VGSAEQNGNLRSGPSKGGKAREVVVTEMVLDVLDDHSPQSRDVVVHKALRVLCQLLR